MKLYHFHVPQSRVAQIDKLIEEEKYPNRSDFVTKAIIEKLEREEVESK